jgi:hypothetical protein
LAAKFCDCARKLSGDAVTCIHMDVTPSRVMSDVLGRTVEHRQWRTRNGAKTMKY